MPGTLTVRERPRIALWLIRWRRPRPPSPPRPDRRALARDLATLPPHLRRDIGL